MRLVELQRRNCNPQLRGYCGTSFEERSGSFLQACYRRAVGRPLVDWPASQLLRRLYVIIKLLVGQFALLREVGVCEKQGELEFGNLFVQLAHEVLVYWVVFDHFRTLEQQHVFGELLDLTFDLLSSLLLPLLLLAEQNLLLHQRSHVQSRSVDGLERS